MIDSVKKGKGILKELRIFSTYSSVDGVVTPAKWQFSPPIPESGPVLSFLAVTSSEPNRQTRLFEDFEAAYFEEQKALREPVSGDGDNLHHRPRGQGLSRKAQQRRARRQASDPQQGSTPSLSSTDPPGWEWR